MAPNSTFTANLAKLKQTGLYNNKNPYAPSGQDPQPTDGHIETPVDQGIHVDNPYAPQRDPQPTDGQAALAPYKPPSMGRQILGALVGGFTKNPNLAGAITGDTNLERQKEALGFEQQRAQIGLAQRTAELTPVTLQNGQTVYLPEKDAAKLLGTVQQVGGRQGVADTAAGARRDVASTNAAAGIEKENISQRYKPVSGIGVFDTQTKQLIPDSEQGITLTPEMAQDFDLPTEASGRHLTMQNLLGLENLRTSRAPKVTTHEDVQTDAQGNLVKIPVTSTSRPMVPGMGAPSGAASMVPGRTAPATGGQSVPGPSSGVKTILGPNGQPLQSRAGAKPLNAQEQTRADMAENLNENLDQLEDIVNRRPELFGPVAGRLTGLRQTIGSDDPDVGALGTIKEQLGMAQASAHSMRNGHLVGEAANSIVNSFHSGPDAIKAAMQKARNSVKTFQSDNNRVNSGSAPQASPQGAMVYHYDANGNRQP